MIAACPHCGGANDVAADSAEGACQRCGKRFSPTSVDEAVGQRRSMYQVLGGAILLFTFLTLLLLLPARNGSLQSAREVIFGAPIADRFGGGGGSGGSG